MKFSPVVLFVYNRVQHTKETLESLGLNSNAENSDLFVFCDGPKSDYDNVDVLLVKEFLNDFKRESPFKSMQVFESSKNRGLARSIIEGVTYVLKQYPNVIVLEDDIVTSIDFIDYCNEALNFYESNQCIWSISGYRHSFDIPKGYKSDIFLSRRGCSWGWATWKDRWEKIDWNIVDYDEFKSSKSKRRKFNLAGNDLSYSLDQQVQKGANSWAIRWVYNQFKFNMYTVYPLVSKVKNIGLDGSGVHSIRSRKYISEIQTKPIPVCFENIKYCEEIEREFKRIFGSRFKYEIIVPILLKLNLLDFVKIVRKKIG